jgi:hypothetical protein
MNSLMRVCVIAGVALMTGMWLSVSWAQEADAELPAAAKQAIADKYPGATIGQTKLERRIVRVYEVDLTLDGKKAEVTVAHDGTILDIEQSVDPEQTPANIRGQFDQVSGGGTLKEVERVEVFAELGAVVLDQPRVEYETEFSFQDRADRGVRWTAEGQPLDDDDDDDDEDDPED